MIKRKYSFIFSVIAVFALFFVVSLNVNAKAESNGEVVISNFVYEDFKSQEATNIPESYVEWRGRNLADVIGGSYYFPDIMGLTYKENVEGAEDGNALKVGFIGFNYTTAVGFGLKFENAIEYNKVGKITLRVYMHIDTSGLSEIRLYSEDGNNYYSFTTAIQDEWIDIEILNEDIEKLFVNGKLNFLNVYIKLTGVRNGNYYDQYSDYWKQEFKGDPSYMYFDTFSYSPYSKTSTVTLNYNKELSGIDSETVTVRSQKIGKPSNPKVLGYAFDGWYLDSDYNVEYDFSSIVTGDMELFAKYSKTVLADGEITDFDENNAQLGYAHIATESYIEWLNHPMAERMGTGFPASGTEFVTDLEGAEDGKALKINFMGLQYTTAVGFSINFPVTVPKENIGKVVIRTFMHIDTDGCSIIKIYSADSAKHFDFTTEKSDKWVDIEISGNDLDKLVTEDNFYGIKVIVVFSEVRTGCYEDIFSIYWNQEVKADPSYMYIDSITYKGVQDVTLNIDGQTKTIQTIDGEPLIVDEIPQKEGYIFTGWEKDGVPFDSKTPIVEPVTLTATFSKETTDYSSVYGVYANGNERIVLNEDKTAFFIKDGEYTEFSYTVSESGILVGYMKGNFTFDQITAGKVVRDGNDYSLEQCVTVTYKYLDSEREILIKSGDSAINLKISIDYYLFGGWKQQGQESLYDFATEALDGLVLIADLKLDEIDDYNDFLGSYYYENKDSLLILSSGNVGEIIENGTKNQIKYYLLNGNIGFYELNGKKYDIEYNSSSIKLESGRHRKLKRYTVSFVNGDNRTNVEVSSGYYTVTPIETPTKEGYTFLGWYEEGSEEPYDFNKVVNASVTLHAKWQEVAKPQETPKKGCKNSIDPIAVLSILSLGAIFNLKKKKEK